MGHDMRCNDDDWSGWADAWRSVDVRISTLWVGIPGDGM